MLKNILKQISNTTTCLTIMNEIIETSTKTVNLTIYNFNLLVTN